VTPSLSLSSLWVSKLYFYFGPGHFGWLLGLSQGVALPLKCPELPACGLSAKAAPAGPRAIAAAVRAVTTSKVMRLLISLLTSFTSHPHPYS